MPSKRGSKWRGMVMVHGQRITATFDTKAKAREWEEAQRRELKSENAGTPSISLLEAMTEYLEEIQLRNSKKNFDEKRFLGRRVIGVWGPDIDVVGITPDMIRRFLFERAKSQSNNAANKDRKNLLAFFHWLEVKDVDHNPVRRLRKMPHVRAPQRIPTQEEVLRLLAAVKGQDRVLLMTYLHTAARRNEVFRLRWDEDVNFSKRMIRLGTRKNRMGEMTYEWLPMNETLYKELWGHYQKRDHAAPFVFTNEQQGHSHQGERFVTRKNWMKRLCKRAGIDPPFGFHALRRYVATALADTHKVSTKTIQRILRHQNVSTTEIYLGNVNRDLEATMKLLEGSDEEERRDAAEEK